MHTNRHDRTGRGKRGRLVAVAVFASLLGGWHPSQAAEFTCAGGDVACLIAAVTAANVNGEANTIRLAAGTYTLTAVDNATDGPNGLPSITSPITIIGEGAEATIIARAASAPRFRLIHVAAAGHLALEGLTLQGGSLSGLISSGSGGGLFNAGGTVTLTQSAIAHNGAARGHSGGGLVNIGGTVTLTQSTIARNATTQATGGGLFNAGGMVTLIQSTIAHNSPGATGSGGGLYNSGGGTVTLTQSTIARNSAGGNGGGLANFAGTVTLTQSTIARNSLGGSGGGGGLWSREGLVTLQNTIIARNGATTGPDCAGPVTSLGHNLIGAPTSCTLTLLGSDVTGDPRLGDFTDDSAPGRGHIPLLPDSPAIDAGDDAVCPPTDQLGQPRVGPCDIGAIEFQGSTTLDTTPPAMTIATSTTTLWPPNRRLVPVTVSGTVTDEPWGSGVNLGSAAYIVMDEYGQIQPRSSLTLEADGHYTFTVALEASRRGNDQDGRHYTIAVSANDNAGNLGVASTTVTVPHDQGQ